MNAQSFVENPSYRSLVRLLNIYCLYRLAFFFWSLDGFLDSLRQSFIGSIVTWLLPAIGPEILLIILSLYRSRTAHRGRIISLFLALGFLLHYFWIVGAWAVEDPSAMSFILSAWFLPSVLNLFCLTLFLILLPRRARRAQEAMPASPSI